jgi:uncharacterized protein (TIGR02444 family)
MIATQTQTETPFWRFSLYFYRQAGVSEACIVLQDDCGIDVNLLLFLLWLAAERRQLSADDVKRIDDRVRDWRNLTIIPIRDIRRKLKGAKTLVDPADQEAFRSKVKAIELDAERLQQQVLYVVTQSRSLGAEAAPAVAAQANIAAYERVLAVCFPKTSVDILLGGFAAIERKSFAAP